MKHFLILTITAAVLSGAFFIFCQPQISLAQEPTFGEGGTSVLSPLNQLGEAGKEAKYATGESQDIRLVIVSLIQYVLLFVGFIFVILMIYGGYLWLTAGGNEDQLGKAKKMIVNAVIAVLIIFLSVSITYTINRILYEAISQKTIGAGVKVK
ncbi:MAG: hypothetical protein PHD51_04210 [Patescibacteria group bacterium]|nr:hypothetical protein [Patescibacteria group bacterium]MDD5490828.1 hypothetical protein [Patescibacteria group bacterium]